jgi:hypothetical protein
MVRSSEEILNEIRQQYQQGAPGTVNDVAQSITDRGDLPRGRMTNWFENRLIDFIFRGQNYIPPTNLYVALFSTRITDDAEAEELSGDGYARVIAPRSLFAWAGTQGPGSVEISNGNTGRTSNNNTVQFPVAQGEWGTALWWAIMDAPAGGNMLYYGELLYPRTIYPGDTPLTFDPGDMTIWVDP